MFQCQLLLVIDLGYDFAISVRKLYPGFSLAVAQFHVLVLLFFFPFAPVSTDALHVYNSESLRFGT